MKKSWHERQTFEQIFPVFVKMMHALSVLWGYFSV